MRWVFWLQHTDGFWIFIQFASLCLFIGAFSPIAFRVNIVMCEFDPAILMLAGCFAHWLMQFPHCIIGLYQLVCFCISWYWMFFSVFSVYFRISCKPGLVATKSLSNCLYVKDFISSSLIKLSLAGYKILS